MSDPVKTSLLKSIEAFLAAATQDDGATLILKKVVRDIDAVNFDVETAPYPLAFIFDETEVKARHNRIAMNTFPLALEIWISKTNIPVTDLCDAVAAELHKKIFRAIFSDASVRRWLMDIKELSTEKFFINDKVGGVTLRYEITYGHKWGDPYDSAK